MLEFDNVYMECKELVWRLVSRYAAKKQDREDLFQEIFLAVYKALPGFRGQSAVSTWVYKIAVNTSINYSKKQSRYRWLQETFRLLRHSEYSLVEEGLEADLRTLAPLQKLSPEQKIIVLLADVEERKLDEIAKIMGIPVGTVKSTLHRSREILKKEVNKNGGL